MDKVTIGVGITTFRRPEMLKKCLDSIRKHTFMDGVTIYVADDSNERLGVSKRKNECLRALKDNDYIFLLDDDVEIIKDGWIEFFVNSGHEHLLYLDKYLHGNPIEHTHYLEFRNCGGVFMFMTKECIEKVGAFNEDFGLYSFEHAEYSNRIYGCKGFYKMLYGTENYIYSEDYSNPNHKSSIGNLEKNELIKKNWDKYFNEPIKNVYLPL
jgi:glycosyltransferase involved in cell wall biosynthesis